MWFGLCAVLVDIGPEGCHDCLGAHPVPARRGPWPARVARHQGPGDALSTWYLTSDSGMRIAVNTTPRLGTDHNTLVTVQGDFHTVNKEGVLESIVEELVCLVKEISIIGVCTIIDEAMNYHVGRISSISNGRKFALNLCQY